MRQKAGEADDVRLTVRLPKGLHTAITAAAQRNHRTFNGELVHTLQAMAYAMPKGSAPPPTE